MSDLNDIVSTVADDPEVKAAAKRLALSAMERAAFLIERGSPPIQAQMIRMLLPTAIASLKERPVDAQDEALRETMSDVIDAVLGKTT